MQKIAILGAGRMGFVHGEAYKTLSATAKIAFVVEHDKEKREAFAQHFACLGVASLDELKPKDVDAVDICLPTYLHKDAILTAATLCRAIFCEKPLCLNQQELDKIAQIIKQNTCVLMAGQVLRFWNGYVKARELVLSGSLGQIRHITCMRRQEPPAWSSGWLFDNAKSGGLLMDLCIHDIDFIVWLLGRPDHISCEALSECGRTLHASLLLRYPNSLAVVTGSWGMPQGFNNRPSLASLEIVGDKGLLFYDGGNQLELLCNGKPKSIALLKGDPYREELAYFLACAAHHEEPARSGLEAIRATMETLWRIK